MQWIGRMIVYMFVQVYVLPAEAYPNYGPSDSYADDYEMNQPDSNTNSTPSDPKERVIRKTKPQPCDKVVNLYVLNTAKSVFEKPMRQCEHPYVAIPVANSNLLLVVVDTMCTTGIYARTNLPRDVEYNQSTLACFKSRYGTLKRRPLGKCISAHEGEKQIELCGHGHRLQHDQTVWLGVLLALLTVLGHFQLLRIHDDH